MSSLKDALYKEVELKISTNVEGILVVDIRRFITSVSKWPMKRT